MFLTHAAILNSIKFQDSPPPAKMSSHRKAPTRVPCVQKETCSQVNPINFPSSPPHHTPRFWRNVSTPHWFPPAQWWIISDCVSPHQWLLLTTSTNLFSSNKKKVTYSKQVNKKTLQPHNFLTCAQQKVTMGFNLRDPSWHVFLPNGRPEISTLNRGTREVKMNSNRVELNRVMTWEVIIIDENPIFSPPGWGVLFVGGGWQGETKTQNLPLEYGEYV